MHRLVSESSGRDAARLNRANPASPRRPLIRKRTRKGAAPRTMRKRLAQPLEQRHDRRETKGTRNETKEMTKKQKQKREQYGVV